MTPDQLINPGDAVIAVDVQNDFCPGGALAVQDGDRVVPVLNHWIEAALAKHVPVIASRDWHPVHHCSFAEEGGPWPPHCIQDTEGAAFHPDLAISPEVIRVSKGTAFDKDNYSAFDGTGLANFLKSNGVKRLWIGGLAQDVCVLATVKDACRLGFETHVLVEGTRAVSPADTDAVLRRMRDFGAVLEEGECR